MTSSTQQSAPGKPDAATDHISGPSSAPVTLIEYGDFECPACRQAYPVVEAMQSHHEGRIRFVFRHFPLREVHPHAEMAAEAAEAAGAQGKFWQFHALLFAHQEILDASHFSQYAKSLGLDMPRFENELKNHVYRQRVQEHIESGNRAGVRATPAFFVDGKLVDVSFGLQRLQDAVDAALQG
jgi:protein-disulfide isomerase